MRQVQSLEFSGLNLGSFGCRVGVKGFGLGMRTQLVSTPRLGVVHHGYIYIYA